MKKYNYLILIILSLILSPYKIYAACTQEEINHFKEIEDEYKVTYELDEENLKYTIILYNPDQNSYVYAYKKNENSICSAIDEKTLKCTNYSWGKYEINIIGQSNKCNSVLKTINLELPKVNEFSKDELCSDIKEFVLCQPTYDKEIDYDTFVSRVNIYKKTKANSKEEEQENKINENIEEVVNYVSDNLVTIIAIVVFTIVIIITIILTAKSIKKSRRLE